jgi:hypothetical protein
MIAGAGDTGFVWRAISDSDSFTSATQDEDGNEKGNASGNLLEELAWEDPDAQTDTGSDAMAITAPDEKKTAKWMGWMVCQWSLGHPQLFWISDALKEQKNGGQLPEFCERVRIVREPISGQPD